MAINRFRFITSKGFLFFLYHIVRLYSRTFRLRVENEVSWIKYLEQGGRVLLCSWHQQFFPAIHYFKNYEKYNPSLMISRSRDGEIIAGVARLCGWTTVRGSSTRGGSDALRTMISNLKASRFSGHVVDGPQGPAGIVKPGVIQLALAADAVIVPFYLSADKAWFFNSWDKFMLPKPFSKVTLKFGEMIKFDTPKNREDFEEQRLELQKIMLPSLIEP